MSANEFLKVLFEKRDLTYEEINKYLDRNEPKLHYEIVREYPRRKGKGLRPTLCLLTCEAFGGKPEKAIKTAAAIQMFEDWVLIHDDVEDDSDMRRGKPALHKLYGKELAINAGDTLHVLMWKVLRDNEEILGPDKTFRVMDEMVEILLTTTAGQFMELSWIRDERFDITEEEYFQMTSMKAGTYTIVGPCKLGAIVANAEEKHLKTIEEFGSYLGVAFQIQDDALNLIGEEKKYGKEIGGDILEGKRTLMLIHLLKNCGESEKEKVIEIYRKKRSQKTVEDVKYVLSLMRKYGSIQYGVSTSRKLAEKAKRIFNEKLGFLPETTAKKNLRMAFDFVIERTF